MSMWTHLWSCIMIYAAASIWIIISKATRCPLPPTELTTSISGKLIMLRMEKCTYVLLLFCFAHMFKPLIKWTQTFKVPGVKFTHSSTSDLHVWLEFRQHTVCSSQWYPATLLFWDEKTFAVVWQQNITCQMSALTVPHSPDYMWVFLPHTLPNSISVIEWRRRRKKSIAYWLFPTVTLKIMHYFFSSFREQFPQLFEVHISHGPLSVAPQWLQPSPSHSW